MARRTSDFPDALVGLVPDLGDVIDQDALEIPDVVADQTALPGMWKGDHQLSETSSWNCSWARCRCARGARL